MQRKEVQTAFKILLEEIEITANDLNEDGANAFKTGNYEAASRAIEEATRLADFREKVKALQKEWISITSKTHLRKGRRGHTATKHLPKGLRTPEEAFRIPILEALIELGGKGTLREVLNLVEKKMRSVLTKYDYKPLSSDPKSIRWCNTAQWCRNSLVREGLMMADSPRGVWEISESGEVFVQEIDKRQSLFFGLTPEEIQILEGKGNDKLP